MHTQIPHFSQKFSASINNSTILAKIDLFERQAGSKQFEICSQTEGVHCMPSSRKGILWVQCNLIVRLLYSKNKSKRQNRTRIFSERMSTIFVYVYRLYE